MDKKQLLQRLEELFRAPEVSGGFPSQEACLSWANRVAPLLRFNQQCHQTFIYHLQVLSRDISVYTAEPTFRTMTSQVEMAIEELKLDIAAEEHIKTAQGEQAKAKATIFKFEPNFHGIGINLPELWRWLKDKFRNE